MTRGVHTPFSSWRLKKPCPKGAWVSPNPPLQWAPGTPYQPCWAPRSPHQGRRMHSRLPTRVPKRQERAWVSSFFSNTWPLHPLLPEPGCKRTQTTGSIPLNAKLEDGGRVALGHSQEYQVRVKSMGSADSRRPFTP